MRFSDQDLHEVAAQLPGKPLVWNHTGTEDHVRSGDSFQTLGATTPAAGPVGTVVDAWVSPDGSGRAIINVTGSRMATLVGTPVADSVSLTHGRDASGRPVPVEMSLVNKPARPGSVVEELVAPSAVSAYKGTAGHATKLTMADAPATAATTETTPAEPAVEKSDVERALESVSDDRLREALSKRMEHMASCAVEANAAADKARKDLERTTEAMNTDQETTAEAIAMWINGLGPELASRWRLQSMKEHQGAFPPQFVRNMVMASFDKFNELSQHRTPAATRSLDDASAAAAAPAAKRARSAAPPAAAAAGGSHSDNLRRALASTFEVGSMAAGGV